MRWYYFMWVLLLGVLIACGSDKPLADNSAQDIAVVADRKALPSCDSLSLHQFYLLRDSSTLVYCDGKAYQTIAAQGAPGSPGDSGQPGTPGIDGAAGVDGLDGVSCSATPITNVGLAITCGNIIDTVWSYVNTPPVAIGVGISGSAVVGSTLQGYYTYVDMSGLEEASSYFQWLRNGQAIPDANDLKYTLTDVDAEQEISFMVVPSSGNLPTNRGVPAISAGLLITSTAYCQNNPQNCGRFTDGREAVGHSYRWVRIGDQVWMAENMAYLPQVHAKTDHSETEARFYVYDYAGTVVADAKATDEYKTYGVLYNHAALEELCPQGWELPTAEQWQELIAFAGGSQKARTTLLSKHLWRLEYKDEYGFGAVPAGLMILSAVEEALQPFFDNKGDNAYWWTADSGYYISNDFVSKKNDRGLESGFSVRCIKQN